MIYQRRSIVGFMLWLRYALMRLRPWTSLDEVYGRYMESPGTKAYSVEEAERMFQSAGFEQVRVRTVLTHGDLLESAAGQRHRGPLLTLARLFWPRRLIRALFARRGLFMLISSVKASARSGAVA